MTLTELENGFVELGRKLYRHDFARERSERFVGQVRTARRARRLAA
jgi:hypothetical protein